MNVTMRKGLFAGAIPAISAVMSFLSINAVAQNPQIVTKDVKGMLVNPPKVTPNLTAVDAKGADVQITENMHWKLGAPLVLSAKIKDLVFNNDYVTGKKIRWDIDNQSNANLVSDDKTSGSPEFAFTSAPISVTFKRAGTHSVSFTFTGDDKSKTVATLTIIVDQPDSLRITPNSLITIYLGGPNATVTPTAYYASDAIGSPFKIVATAVPKGMVRLSVEGDGNIDGSKQRDQNVVEVESGKPVTITSLNTGDFKIQYSSPGWETHLPEPTALTVAPVTITITSPVIGSRTVREGKTIAISAVVKAGDNQVEKPNIIYSVTDGKDSLKIDPSTGVATGQSISGTAKVIATEQSSMAKSQSIDINVESEGRKMSMVPSNTVSFVNKPVNFTLNITDATGAEIGDIDKWQFKVADDPSIKAWSIVNNQLLVTIGQLGTTVVKLEAKSPGGDVTLKVQSVISTPQVTGFQPVKVALDVVDDQTAQFLFGKQVAQDFHVLRVRLFNNLKDHDTQQKHDAILAYSESIEVRVTLEKKYNSKYKSAGIMPVNPVDLWHLVDDSEFISGFTPLRANDENPAPKSARRYGFLINGIPQTGVLLLGPNELLHAELMTADGVPIRNKVTFEIIQGDKKPLLYKGEGKFQAQKWDEKDSNHGPGIATIVAKIDGGRLGDARIQVAVYSPKSNDGNLQVEHEDRPFIVNIPRRLRFDSNHIPTGEVTWGSSNEIVAKVDGSGTIFPNKPGETIITVSRGESSVRIPIYVVEAFNRDLPPSVFYDGLSLKYMRHRFLYRPYAYDMMVNSLDPRNEGSGRNSAFRLMDIIGTAASFLGSVNLKGVRGPTGNLVLDKYSNFLIPNLKRIYPDMRETQRQNFVSMAMKPIEEIPFGSDIARVLFVPKQKMMGMLRGYDIRIAEVDTSYFNVTVALIDKTQTQQTGNVAGTGGQ